MPEVTGLRQRSSMLLGMSGTPCPNPAPNAWRAPPRDLRQWPQEAFYPSRLAGPARPPTSLRPQEAIREVDSGLGGSAMGSVPICPPALMVPIAALSPMVPRRPHALSGWRVDGRLDDFGRVVGPGWHARRPRRGCAIPRIAAARGRCPQ